MPTLREQLLRDGPIHVAAFTVAAWIRFLQGTDDAGAALPFGDGMGSRLQDLARQGVADPAGLLAIPELFGSDLSRSPRFVTALREYLANLCQRGAKASLAALIGCH